MQTRKNWEVFAPGKSTGAGACCRYGFLIGPIGLLAQWGERVGRKIKWKREKISGKLANSDRKQVSGLNWMQCGPFENDTDWFVILGDIWREGEGRCFWRMFFHIPRTWFKMVKKRVLLPLVWGLAWAVWHPRNVSDVSVFLCIPSCTSLFNSLL